MGTALDRLKKSVSMKPQRKVVDLPDGSEFEFFAPPITLAQRAKAQKLAPGDDATAFALQLLVMVATDESGEKLFQSGEIVELKQALPANVVESLLLPLLVQSEEEEEEPTDMKRPRQAAKG